MRILIINASPRRHGCISQMLDLMCETAIEQGAETDILHTSELQVRSCTGCMSCRSARQCCLPPDDAQRTLQLLQEADVLIVGAPCYWGNMPGTLKLLFDRMVYGMMGEGKRGIPQPLHTGKKAIIVTACTTPYPFSRWFNQSKGTVKAIREILKWSGFKIATVIEKAGTRQHPELKPKELERCRKAVRQILF